ncbi:iron chaperone [Intrasporangium sp.]|uniref:iron chaperone n=1 Tax=Intrasporangium sp. TaxID=1925024 RepID=UPI002939FC97|nr:DUF1801 domain-containing protein [Intrasporangium sp.]MDV3222004.1 DUF1801 domain-containing protein [Intrasporangium sp.]
MGTVTDYLAGIEEADRRAALARVIELARGLVPDAEEGVGYGMPALRHRGKPLIAAVAAAQHLSLFPFSSAVVEAVAADLDGYSLSKGTIRFDADRPVPDEVVERIVRMRVAEIEGRA